MVRRFYLVLFMVCACIVHSLHADTWRVFFYMDCSDGLSDMGIKNLTDMMRGAPNDNVEFLVQLHAYDDVALRYSVTANGLMFVEQARLTGDSAQDFYDAARWGLTNVTTDHVMVILSNHGWGILDPRWNEAHQTWQVDEAELSNTAPATCTVKRSSSMPRRGFMFSATPRTYLNNQGLVDGIAYIQQNLLGGKKIDIFAFDTCMGDMLEVAYESAPFAQYLVGNQSCSLRDGFDYQGIIPLLNAGGAPRDVAAGMVRVFDSYYAQHDDSGIYTHAAVDLSQVYAVRQALDAVVAALLVLPNAQELVVAAREDAPRFCLWPMYTDPVAFCKQLESLVADVPASPEIDVLVQTLHDFYAIVELFVVARCGGFTTEGRAYGCAIYLPEGAVDRSYVTTVFARESRWLEVLGLAC